MNAPWWSSLVACPDCDLMQRLPSLPRGARGRCRRCRRVLARRPAVPRDMALALACTAAVVYVVANLLPLMDLHVVGRSAHDDCRGRL